MAPAAEECSPALCASPARPARPARPSPLHEEDEAAADDVAHETETAPEPASPDSCCCRCCASWQRRKRSRPPRGTDKVGSADNETLLAGGNTRFYCCESKMTTRPPRGLNTGRNSASASRRPETATAVNPGLCSMFKVRRKDSDIDEVGVNPVEFAFDAFDERAYMEEFEVIHQEEYDVSRTIVNPITPHSEILLHPSQVGRVIIIKGKTNPNAQRFAVNLICRGKNDIAMHFNPRLDRGYIARNSKLNGSWGTEENSLNGPSPFRPDKEFTLQILVTDEEYRFCHNGRHICSYGHRVPIARLHILDIHGDISLSMVRHQMVDEFPPPSPPVSVDDLRREPQLLSVGHTPLSMPTSHSWKADIPKQSFFFLGRFESHLSIGNEIHIGGNVRLLPHAFFVNLQDGLQMWRPPSVHFHINPRFEDHNHTVVNARLKGAWGYEERHSRCRFQPGRPFTLTIRIEQDRYVALVNGCLLASMDHRARPSEINSLYISGDVDIKSIAFSTTLSTLKSKKEVTVDESEWVDLSDDTQPTNGTDHQSESPVPAEQVTNPEPISRRNTEDPEPVGLSQPSTSKVPEPSTGSEIAVSQKDSGSLSNGQPPQLSAVVDRNPGLSNSSEIEAGRDRGDSVVSDEIFMSAQHSLEPSISSNRNSLLESSEFVSSMSKNKTDNEENPRKS